MSSDRHPTTGANINDTEVPDGYVRCFHRIYHHSLVDDDGMPRREIESGRQQGSGVWAERAVRYHMLVNVDGIVKSARGLKINGFETDNASLSEYNHSFIIQIKDQKRDKSLQLAHILRLLVLSMTTRSHPVMVTTVDLTADAERWADIYGVSVIPLSELESKTSLSDFKSDKGFGDFWFGSEHSDSRAAELMKESQSNPRPPGR